LFSWENSSYFVEATDLTEETHNAIIVLAPFLIQWLVVKRHHWWMQQLMQSGIDV